MRTETKKVEGALIPLAAAARLLKSDLIYGRFAPEDFRTFQNLFRRLAGRADGLGVYLDIGGTPGVSACWRVDYLTCLDQYRDETPYVVDIIL